MAFSQQKARDTLSLYQAVGMAFGGKPKDVSRYLEALRKTAGGHSEKEQKKADKPKKLSESFGGMLGIPTAEEFKALQNQRKNQENS